MTTDRQSPALALAEAVRATLAAHADVAQAGPMQAYMKSALPFHGVPAPLRRQLVKAAVQNVTAGVRDPAFDPFADADALCAASVEAVAERACGASACYVLSLLALLVKKYKY